MARKILLVDDDMLMRRSMAYNLNQAGYATMTAATAEDALAIAENDPPDLVLLDINLPHMDGLDALKHLKFEVGIPVIFVTARRRELDEVLGLEMGADDYVTKPFSMDVLLARIKTVLRRTEMMRGDEDQKRQPLVVGDLVIDPLAHTVQVNEHVVDLAPRAFDLLHVLACNAGRVLSTGDLLAQVWGAEYEGEPQVVYVHIRWLREKLEEDPSNPKRIVTVRGIGYKFLSSEALNRA